MKCGVLSFGGCLIVELRLENASYGLFLLNHACMFTWIDNRVLCVCIIVYI